MKIIIKPVLGIFLFLILAGNAYSQREFSDGPPPNGRIDELRKEKLMEKLEINEATANKFFDLFEKNIKKLRTLYREKRKLIAEMEKDISMNSEINLESKLERLLNIDSEMDAQRREYINELKTILTPKQIVQSIILQQNFTRELKKEINKQQKRRLKEN